jgi:hypothetical protein
MPEPNETAIRPPTTPSHLEITDEDIAASFRPWAAPGSEPPADSAVPHPIDGDPLDPIFADDALYAMVQALPTSHVDTADRKLRRKASAMHLLRSLDAQQPVEAALATQAVLFHYASLAALRRATRSPPASEVSAGFETASAARASALFCRLLHELAAKQESIPNTKPAPSKPRWRR